MRLSTAVIIACMVSGIAVLCGLGTWQVKRLIWKEALIEQVEAKIGQPAMKLPEFLELDITDEAREYTPVTFSGEFDHSVEVYFYATNKKGAAGWNVHTPLKLEDGRYLVVNRGFVPFGLKEANRRNEGLIGRNQTISGLVRIPSTEKPNRFVPDNALDKREFYWRDLKAMTGLMNAGGERKFLNFFVDADATAIPGGWPEGGTTIVSFPNNHLQYAITWYGLALALLGVGSFFLYSRRQNTDG